ncbi:hypothetical protein [[Eubacterium] cellulosolvens]
MRPLSYPPQWSLIIQTAIYIASFAIIAYFIYYIPNYFFLEWFTAQHSASILTALGLPSLAKAYEGMAFVNEVQIVKQCTGIQVVAVFAGLLIPLPQVGWKVKLQSLALIFFAVYLANVLRIVIELTLLYRGILPWSLAHEPLGTVLGIVSVAIFLITVDRFIPQIGDTIVRGYQILLGKKSKE